MVTLERWNSSGNSENSQDLTESSYNSHTESIWNLEKELEEMICEMIVILLETSTIQRDYRNEESMYPPDKYSSLLLPWESFCERGFPPRQIAVQLDIKDLVKLIHFSVENQSSKIILDFQSLKSE